MGLLFHNVLPAPFEGDVPPSTAAAAETHVSMLGSVIEAHLLGGLPDVLEMLTDDVVCSTPLLCAHSLEDMTDVCGTREESLTDVVLKVCSFHVSDDVVGVEWQLTASFTAPVLLEDDLLLEPTGERVHLTGATIAEFRGELICSIRHYFDDTEMIVQMAALPYLPRWRSDLGRWRRSR